MADRCPNCGLHNLVLTETTGRSRCPGCLHVFVEGEKRYFLDDGTEIEYIGRDDADRRQFRMPTIGVILTAFD